MSINVVIAPDSFKGSLSAYDVAVNIEKGIKKVMTDAECIIIPMADGGEGTVQALVDAHNGTIINKEVIGPTGKKVSGYFGIIDNKTAVIEMAAASGLSYVDINEIDPTKTTTYGTGQLILEAIENGAKNIIIGIGGSATMDAGVGMLQALGFEFKDAKGNEIGFGGKELAKILKIETKNIDKRLKNIDFKVACDVSNPLYGPKGAAYVYGPQKGATKKMIKKIDENLRHFNEIIKDKYNKDAQKIPGAGAAGGLGAALTCFLNAEMQIGAEIVSEANNLKQKIKNADLVITGEGKIDEQTINNKAPIIVAKMAEKYCPVIAIAGSLGVNANIVYDYGLEAIFSIITSPGDLEETMDYSPDLIVNVTENIFRLIKLFDYF